MDIPGTRFHCAVTSVAQSSNQSLSEREVLRATAQNPSSGRSADSVSGHGAQGPDSPPLAGDGEFGKKTSQGGDD